MKSLGEVFRVPVLRKYAGSGIVFIVLLSLTFIFAMDKFGIPYASDLSHMLMVLTAMMGVHIIERVFFWQEITEENKTAVKEALESHIEILNSTSECGIKRIYKTRKSALKDIKSTVKQANRRVWLLGAAVARDISMEDLLPIIHKKIVDENIELDFKVLLLDPHSPAAIFRTLLESESTTVSRMVDEGFDISQKDQYYNQGFYMKFFNAYKKATEYKEITKGMIRFYTQSPSCWMILVDDEVYFQPYSFDVRSDQIKDNSYLGTKLPILLYDNDKNNGSFGAIKNHFSTLWNTSNIGLLEMTINIEDRDHRVRQNFKINRDHFKYISDLFNQEIEQRKFIRRKCQTKQAMNIIYNSNDNSTVIDGLKLHDYSEFGMCLSFDNTNNEIHALQEDLRIKVEPDKEKESNFQSCDELKLGHKEKNAQIVLDILFEMSFYYVISWINHETGFLGIRMEATQA